MEKSNKRDYDHKGHNPQQAHTASNKKEATDTYNRADHELKSKDSSVASGTNPDRYEPVNKSPETGNPTERDDIAGIETPS